MKNLLLIVCMAIMGAITHTAEAQTPDKSPAATKAQRETDKLVKELKLDPKEKVKVYEANLEFEKELEKLEKTKLTKEEKLAKKEALRQKQLQHLKTVLKPEQYEKVAAKLNGKPGKKPQPKANNGNKGGKKKS